MPANRNIESGKVDVYARSILQCADGDRDKVFGLDGQLRRLVEIFFLNKRLATAFTDESIELEQRRERAAQVFEPFDEALRPILVTMAVRGDIPLVPRIAEAYTELAEETLGSVIVDVTTVVELDDHLREVIKDKLARDFGREAMLREHIDPKIIGGIVLSAHGRRIDASIASQLELARETLSTTPTGGER